MAEFTIAEYVARIMKEEGVKQYFGVHGGHIWALMAAVEAEGGIKMYHVRHEQSGAYAADGFARASGTVGVCFGTAGPGMANMVPALLHCYHCKSPVVAFAGQHTTAEDGWGPFQEGYADEICGSFTKWTKRVIDPTMTSYFVQKAFRDAVTYPPGPVVVELPVNILGKSTDEKDQRGYLPKGKCASPAKPAGDPAVVEKAVRMLLKAKKPIVIGGDGIYWAKASDDLKEFVELLNIPVHTRRMGRGAVPESHPLAFGGGYRRPLLNQADVIVLFGLRMNMLEHFGMPPTYPVENAKYIMVSEDFEELTTRIPAEISIFGNPKIVLRQMIDCARDLLKKKPERTEWLSIVSKAKKEDEKKTKELVTAARAHKPIHPDALAFEAVSALAKDATVILDSFSMSGWTTDKVSASFAGQILDAATDGGVGHGVGMAIGAQLARPGKQVLEMLGDGGLGISGWDIETAARHNIPACYFLFNNSHWGGTRKGQDVSPFLKRDQFGMTKDVKYHKIFAEMGCHTELVTELEQVQPALKRAFASGKTSLINVIVDGSIAAPQFAARIDYYRAVLGKIGTKR